MIPINKRLDSKEEKEYISNVKECMDTSQWNKLRRCIEWIFIDIEKHDYSLYEDLGTINTYWERETSEDYIIYSWLILDYNLLERIKNYIDSTYIVTSLEKYNCILRRYGYKELQSYCDLVRRRKLAYDKQKIVSVELNKPNDYDTIYLEFTECKNTYDQFSKRRVNDWIIGKANVNVCPYCNLAYTYNRKEKVTAQLDHFFSKSEYPMFSLCYYNLIPSCPACNHIKLDNSEKMSSPYEENAFENMEITWRLFDGSNPDEKTLRELSNSIQIKISSNKVGDTNNIKIMKLNEAYNYHKDYASEIIKKMQSYLDEDSKKLIQSIAFKNAISDDEIEYFYFGTYLDDARDTDRILTKMVRDFAKQYKEMKD